MKGCGAKRTLRLSLKRIVVDSDRNNGTILRQFENHHDAGGLNSRKDETTSYLEIYKSGSQSYVYQLESCKLSLKLCTNGHLNNILASRRMS